MNSKKDILHIERNKVDVSNHVKSSS